MGLGGGCAAGEVHGAGDLVDGEAGPGQKIGHFYHAQARQKLFYEVGLLFGQMFRSEEMMESPSIGARVVAGEMVGGEGFEILVGLGQRVR